MFIEHIAHPLVGLHCPPHTGVFFAKLFQKAFGTCHSVNGDVVAAAAAAAAATLLVDACGTDIADKLDVDAMADDIVKSDDVGDVIPAAAAAANAFNNFKSFLRADDDADPLDSTHIT